VHAGNVLKSALASVGGRGGGSATLAQGSVANRAALDDIVRALQSSA